ncbi:hypothetical protein VTK26DRAFT_549 [Humicola hyalothermophila]
MAELDQRWPAPGFQWERASELKVASQDCKASPSDVCLSQLIPAHLAVKRMGTLEEPGRFALEKKKKKHTALVATAADNGCHPLAQGFGFVRIPKDTREAVDWKPTMTNLARGAFAPPRLALLGLLGLVSEQSNDVLHSLTDQVSQLQFVGILGTDMRTRASNLNTKPGHLLLPMSHPLDTAPVRSPDISTQEGLASVQIAAITNLPARELVGAISVRLCPPERD